MTGKAKRKPVELCSSELRHGACTVSFIHKVLLQRKKKKKKCRLELSHVFSDVINLHSDIRFLASSNTGSNLSLASGGQSRHYTLSKTAMQRDYS